jgi:phosphate transport system protein
VLRKAADSALLTTKDAVFNVADLITTRSAWAVRAIADCEKELDRLEREADGILPKAITRVPEPAARELLAEARMVTELERIGDLLLGVANQLRTLPTPLSQADRADLLAMTSATAKMIEDLRSARTKRELEDVASVLRADREIDRLRSAIFHRHLGTSKSAKHRQDQVRVLFTAQALERAGDHATNIAEELYRSMSGETLRHVPARERRSKLEG